MFLKVFIYKQKKVTLQEQLKETEKEEEESKQRFKEKLDAIEPHHKHLKVCLTFSDCTNLYFLNPVMF